jgi:ribose transport system substrate-binding protein
MKFLRASGWLAAALTAAGLPACNRANGPDAARPRVAFVSNNPEAFWTIAEHGTKKAAGEENVEVLFRKPAQGDASVQKEVIDQVMGQGIKALAVSVIDPKNQAPYLNEIAERVPLITQDNDAPNTKRLCYIGTDNYEAGKAVGQLIKEALPDGGVIAIFVGQLEPLNARQRRQGVLDELAGAKDVDPEGKTFGKYRLHRTYTDQPEGGQRCKENAVDAVTALQNEKAVCFVGLWEYNPPNILSALADKGKLGQVKVVGFDENPATLQGVADGHVTGTVVQQPFLFGYESVRLMAALARGDKSKLPPGGVRHVPHKVITRANVAEFRDELDRMLGKKQ